MLDAEGTLGSLRTTREKTMQTEDLNKQMYTNIGERGNDSPSFAHSTESAPTRVQNLATNRLIREALHPSRKPEPTACALASERENSGFSV